MFRVSHEFTFSLPQNEDIIKFIGQLVFKSNTLNDIGALYTQEEINTFASILNTVSGLPEYWTLEILTQSLYDKIKYLFENLHGINLFISGAEYRVAEYTVEDFQDSNILELPGIVG